PLPGDKGNSAQSDVVDKVDAVQGHGLDDDHSSLGLHLIEDLGLHRGDIVTEVILVYIVREDPIGQLGLSRYAALGNNGVPYGPPVQDPALKFQNQGFGLIDLEKYVLRIGPRSGTELQGDTVKIDGLYLKVIIATGKKQPGTKHQKESSSHTPNLRQF